MQGNEIDRTITTRRLTALSLSLSHSLSLSLQICFILPNGKKDSTTFYLGQTVEYLKSYVSRTHDIDMKSQILKLGDSEMFDPLSLSDFEDIVEDLKADVKVIMKTKR